MTDRHMSVAGGETSFLRCHGGSHAYRASHHRRAPRSADGGYRAAGGRDRRGLTPGERLAVKAGFAGEVSEEFEGIMREVLEARRDRAPRPASRARV